jgi:hypothetical protein
MYTGRMTKFILVIWLCSAVTTKCYDSLPKPLEYDNYWSCMRDGYGKSFELLFGNTKKQDVEKYRFYTRWMCKELNVKVI